MNSQSKVIVFKAPQRVLVTDILNRLAGKLEAWRPGKQAYLSIKSGGSKNQQLVYNMRRAGLEFNEIEDTTNPENIRNTYENALGEEKDLIIVTTYASTNKIKEAAIPVDLEICDEVHHCCEKDNLMDDDFRILPTSKVLGMTATPIINLEIPQLSMDNKAKFGEQIRRGSRWAIENRIILSPSIHFMVREKYDDKTKRTALVSAILDGFTRHEYYLKKHSSKPELIGTKLLVALPSCSDLKEIRDSEQIRDLIDQNVNIISIDSANGGFINKAIYSASMEAKEAVRAKLDNLKSSDRAIILQVAMLGEGIDVPGITAVMPLCEQGERRIFQLLGRALRILPEDRPKYVDKTYKPIKKYGYAILPTFGPQDETWIRTIRNKIRRFRNEYGYIPCEERILVDGYSSRDNEEDNRTKQQFIDNTFKHMIEQDVDTIVEAACYELIYELQDHPDLCKELLTSWKIYDETDGKYEAWSDKVGDYVVMFKESSEDTSWKYIDVIKELRSGGADVFSEEIISKFGTIYTPDFVVKPTCDLAWKYQDKSINRLDQTYCDPGVGDGNFLIEVYERLLKEPSDNIQKHGEPDSIQRSRWVLMNCLWGYEIIEQMHWACKIRLTTTHLALTKKIDPSKLPEQKDIFDNLHIYHGNTLLLPEEKDKWPKEKFEGGLLSDEIREKKYDCVLGNPPYGHLRNLANRRYGRYPKQRDLAQCFVRWGLDHITEKGVVSYNITDAWLNVKVCDGALETRKLLEQKIKEIIQDNQIMLYSKGTGNIDTIIVCFSNQLQINYKFNNIDYNFDERYYKPGLLKLLISNTPFKNVLLVNYTTMSGYRSNNKSNKKFNEKFNNLIYDEEDKQGKYYIVCKRIMGCRSTGSRFKFIKTNNIINYINNNISSEIKYCEVNKEIGIWLIGYLNTKTALEQLKLTLRNGNTDGNDQNDWLLVVAAGTFANLQIPDFDWYKTNHPQFIEYMKWIENNMKDKDKFLAGIDEQFDKLIGDK